MPTYEVEKDLIIHVKVKVRVEAEDKAAAIDRAAEQLPHNFDRDSLKGWSAKVDVKAPKSVNLEVGRAYHFEQASGSDKARKIA